METDEPIKTWNLKKKTNVSCVKPEHVTNNSAWSQGKMKTAFIQAFHFMCCVHNESLSDIPVSQQTNCFAVGWNPVLLKVQVKLVLSQA